MTRDQIDMSETIAAKRASEAAADKVDYLRRVFAYRRDHKFHDFVGIDFLIDELAKLSADIRKG